jgi:cell division protein FtsI (penicillin-binding protein 3)
LAILEDKVADTSTVYDTHGEKYGTLEKLLGIRTKAGTGKISLARGFELSSNTVLVQAVYDNYKTI